MAPQPISIAILIIILQLIFKCELISKIRKTNIQIDSEYRKPALTPSANSTSWKENNSKSKTSSIAISQEKFKNKSRRN